MPSLVCHPESATRVVRAVHAQVTRANASLAVTYVIEGDAARLRLAPPRPPRVAERLWQHTCCELFIARAASPAYQEFNFSPSGEWAAYAFADYRQGGPLEAHDPGIVLKAFPGKTELRASVAAARGPLLLGLCAVIEARDGTLSYWALRHAPGKPDFHHRAAFALELA